jgi:hypothetical protein
MQASHRDDRHPQIARAQRRPGDGVRGQRQSQRTQQQRLGPATLFGTRDQEEALSMAEPVLIAARR